MLPTPEVLAEIERVQARLKANGVAVNDYSYTDEAVTFHITTPTFLDMTLVPGEIDGRRVLVQIHNEDELYVKAGA